VKQRIPLLYALNVEIKTMFVNKYLAYKWIKIPNLLDSEIDSYVLGHSRSEN